MDRINLITDAAALAKVGLMQMSSALDLAYKFSNDSQRQLGLTLWECLGESFYSASLGCNIGVYYIYTRCVV
jgi:hypothetical protein